MFLLVLIKHILGIYRQYGIRARNDNFQVSSSFGVEGFSSIKPIRVEDRSDLNTASSNSNARAKYLHDLGYSSSDNEKISSTLRSVTSSKSTKLYVWDGKELPKNHKM